MEEDLALLLDLLDVPRPKVAKITNYRFCSHAPHPAVVGGAFAAADEVLGSHPSTPNSNQRSPYLERLSVKVKILSMNPVYFKRSYRLHRDDFMDLLSKIRPRVEYSNPFGTHHCDDDCGHIDPLIQLAATLRLLAGGSYLDICFGYHISTGTIYKVFWRVLKAIDAVVDNINFDYDSEEAMEELEATFAKISKGAFRGTVAAGDGIIFRRTKPAAADVDGNVRSFFTRKGFWGHAVQAFCDGNCKFVHVSQRVCASTHDGTAYVMTGIAQKIKEGKLSKKWHVVLDEAYKCTDQELSPWKGRQLPSDKDVFNYYLSLHRQVIERAFGILVSRWGIFWRLLRFSQAQVELIVQVCMKLHNICISRFGSGSQAVDVSIYDKQWVRGHDEGADSTVLYTDGTGSRQGERSDLLTTRQAITQHLQNMSLSRPQHSKTKQMLQRIKDVTPSGIIML